MKDLRGRELGEIFLQVGPQLVFEIICPLFGAQTFEYGVL